MATIEQLARKIIELEQKLDVALSETEKLQQESKKALDTAMHAYELDDFGYLWVYDAETKKYRQTKMRVMTPEIAEQAIKPIHIAEGAVTGDKIEDEAVIPGKIADNAVATRNIKRGAVDWDTLSPAVQNIVVTGGGQHGIPLSTEFGDSDMVGITQKTLTESKEHLQGEIDDLDDKCKDLAEASEQLQDKVDDLDAESDIDETNRRYLLNKDNRRFFIPMTELVKPLAPTIAVTQYAVITGNFNVQVTNRAPGSTMYYRLSEESQWLATSGTITIDSGYSNASDNEEKQYSIQLKCILNGEESDVNEVTITVTPKVASGGISIVRRPNNNDYATEATITLTPSPTKDAVSTYTVNNGSPIAFTEPVVINVDVTQAAGKYKVNATKEGYVNAEQVTSSQVTLNRKKFYYGMGDATLANEAAIKSLAGGGSLEQSTMAGTYNINVTSETVGKYAWFCGTGTLTSVTSGGFAVPMEAVVVVDGYNCYRTSSPIQETGSNTFNVQ